MRLPSFVLCAVLCATAVTAGSDGLQVRGIDGHAFALFAPKGQASAVFFVATDCPISNWYAPTIQQVCRDYAARGVDCTLIYEDVDLGAKPAALDAAVRTHLREYGYGSIAATVDRHDPVSRPHRQRLRRTGQAASARDVARPARVARRAPGRTACADAGDRSPRLLHR
jgi:hypothetical protein